MNEITQLLKDITNLKLTIDNINKQILEGFTNLKIISNIIDLKYINERIEKEICYETIDKLSDNNLLDKYKNTESVKKRIRLLNSLLCKYDIESNKKDLILNDYLLELIPSGTKGIIRGNEFNNIVKNTIMNLQLDNTRFDIYFEKHCELCNTSEIPDWYILEKVTNKVIIGMNQLDLWNGGHQLNRGYKYIIDNKYNTEKTKLLCVICNKIKIMNTTNKIYKLFSIGYKNDTICYIKNIESIINKYFN